jgi:hypothetical protein
MWHFLFTLCCNMKFHLILSILILNGCLLFSNEIRAQKTFILSGVIKDSLGQNMIKDVMIIIENKDQKFELISQNGDYSIPLSSGNYIINFKKIGYEELTLNFVLDKNLRQDIILIKNNTKILKDVVVYSNNDKLKNSYTSKESINIKDLEKMPVFFGEQDILKSILLQPGVTSSGDGSSSYYVRGGSVDQNLILYDEATLYNPSHILGFFSSFNNDIIKEAILYKGNMPAQYGGRLSSILDVKTREGNDKETKVSGGIGNITSKLSLEGPLREGNSSFLFSVRKTHINYLLQLSDKYKKNKIDIYDINFKINNEIDSNNKITFSGYKGNDNVDVGSDLGVNWSNQFMTIQWENKINLNHKSTSTLYTSNYVYNNLFKTTSTNWILNSGIKDYGIKQNFEYNKKDRRINYGFNSIYYLTEPKTFIENLNNGLNNNEKKGIENVLYYNNDTRINKFLAIEYGLRLNFYTNLYKEAKNNIGDIINQSGEIDANKNNTYFNLEPRLSTRFNLNNSNFIKFALSRNIQHLHLLNNANIYEQWIANSDKVLPEISDQINIGLEKWSKNNFFQLNVDVYYKNLQNQIDFKEGISFNSIIDYENAITFGRGRSYGIEMKVMKHNDILSGWISYGLSKNERLIDGINNNKWYNSIQDRTHNLSLLAMYKINRKINISGVFVFNSGSAITYPIGRYSLFEQNVFLYGERNANRTPSYHRLDLSFNYETISKKKIMSKWNFTLFNAYGRENPFRINFKQNPSNENETKVIQTALFKWVPSINYNFIF